MIIRGGYNVYPREIEEVLYEHPAVSEAAVIGVPDDAMGEEVGAAVVLRAGHDASADDIRAFVKERVAAYKYPRRIWFLDGCPRPRRGRSSSARSRSPRRRRASGGAADARARRPQTRAERRPRRTAPARSREPLDALLTQAALGPGGAGCPGGRASTAAKLALRPPVALRAGSSPRAGEGRGRALQRRAAERGDRRFKDPAWEGNSAFRRLMQAYLATGRTVDRLIATPTSTGERAARALRGRERPRRARADEQPAHQPDRAQGGGRHGRAQLRPRGGATSPATWRTPPRIPSMVDRSAFEVGRQRRRHAGRGRRCARRCSSSSSTRRRRRRCASGRCWSCRR